MRKAVTIKSIAEQLGLSRNTVAKALNGQYVPESTRECVLKKAQELNYKSMNLTHIALGKKKYKILLVSGKPLSNINYFIPLVKGIENSCYENNYDLFQLTYNVSTSPFAHLSEHVKELRADGIVAIECFDKNFIAKLVNLGLPICFYDFSADNVKSATKIDIIRTNDKSAVSEIVNLLHNKYKTERFTFVGDRKHCLSFYARYIGMRMGIMSFSDKHTVASDILCNDESFPYGNPEAIKTEILKLRRIPDCFVCCNDFVARNVCHALSSLNIKVPNDVMIIGFDNIPEATALSPNITSFSIDKEFLGREMIRTLVQRIENPNIPSRMVTLRTEMILRESTDRND